MKTIVGLRWTDKLEMRNLTFQHKVEKIPLTLNQLNLTSLANNITMAVKAPPPSPSTPSAIKQFSNFTRTGAGLEKTLRLIQALATIVIETSIDNETVTTWSTAKSQLALSQSLYLRHSECTNL